MTDIVGLHHSVVAQRVHSQLRALNGTAASSGDLLYNAWVATSVEFHQAVWDSADDETGHAADAPRIACIEIFFEDGTAAEWQQALARVDTNNKTSLPLLLSLQDHIATQARFTSGAQCRRQTFLSALLPAASRWEKDGASMSSCP
eukprot:TRINITY_DN21885_c0_g3_i2.p2 TRINITY_DN21885_c0_g3~~TRINITY_DN21885_c0_g3_i2.p2  ORF type:complete len:146 (-),score=18.47 TRINITY_DN21885_c0_g3_i2:807-1244(-)